MTFTKQSGKHLLSIKVDKEMLLQKIDEKIQEYTALLDTKIENDEAGCEIIYEHSMQSVYGDIDDFCTAKEIIEDLNDFKKIINNVCDNPEKLWKNVSLKKNGTFKLTCKPILKEAINGSYWEDSYGWNTLILRIIPRTDLLAIVDLDYIVVHY